MTISAVRSPSQRAHNEDFRTHVSDRTLDRNAEDVPRHYGKKNEASRCKRRCRETIADQKLELGHRRRAEIGDRAGLSRSACMHLGQADGLQRNCEWAIAWPTPDALAPNWRQRRPRPDPLLIAVQHTLTFRRAAHLGLPHWGTGEMAVSTSDFIANGFIVIRNAVAPAIVAACMESIGEQLEARGVNPRDRSTWVAPVVRIPCPEGPAFTAAGTAPALHAVYDA